MTNSESALSSATTSSATTSVTKTAAPKEETNFRWQCRRGMLELDILLNNFVDVWFDDNCEEPLTSQQLSPQHSTSKSLTVERLTAEPLTAEQEQTFTLLLTYPDQTLLDLLLGNAMSSDAEISAIVQLIQTTSNN